MFDINKIGEKLLKLGEVKNTFVGDTVFFLKEGNAIGEGELTPDWEDGIARVLKTEPTDIAIDAIAEAGHVSMIPENKIFSSVDELKDFYSDLFEEKIEAKKSDICTVVPKRKAWNINEESFKENLTDKTIYPKVIAFVTNFLSEFNIPARFKLKFHSVRNASYSEGGYIDSGDISLGLDLVTISNVKIHADMVVPVRDNKLIEPSIMFLNGSPRVIAQSLFDDIVSDNTFSHQLYKGPERFVSPEMLKLYQDSKITTVNTGVFGLE